MLDLMRSAGPLAVRRHLVPILLALAASPLLAALAEAGTALKGGGL